MISDYHQGEKKHNNFAVFTLKCWEYLNISHSKAGERRGGFYSVQYGIKAVSSPAKFSFSYKSKAVN